MGLVFDTCRSLAGDGDGPISNIPSPAQRKRRRADAQDQTTQRCGTSCIIVDTTKLF